MLLQYLSKDSPYRKVILNAMVRRLKQRVETERSQHEDGTGNGVTGNSANFQKGREKAENYETNEEEEAGGCAS